MLPGGGVEVGRMGWKQFSCAHLALAVIFAILNGALGMSHYMLRIYFYKKNFMLSYGEIVILNFVVNYRSHDEIHMISPV